MSATDSLHYKLCVEGAKWLRRRENREGDGGGQWKYVAVEMCVNGIENPDIWAFNGWSSIVVEVKTSRADFHNDKKKPWHQIGMEHCFAGNFRYYLTPQGMLNKSDLPKNVGLLEWDGKKISRTIHAERTIQSNTADLVILASLLRRECVREGIYNYRKKNVES